MEQRTMMPPIETVTAGGLRARAQMLREKGEPNDSGSTARHLELAADEIDRLALLLPSRPIAPHGSGP